jgi:uncharacterized protein (TIGR03546 family)
MLLPRPIGKFVAVLRGSVAPPLIFLSILLGFWMGMMPGWSGLHTALAVIVLVLNVHIGLFLLSLGLGKGLSLALAPLLYHLGVWAHGHLAGVLQTLAATPVLGITDFSRYALVGGMLVGPVVGGVIGLVMAVIVFNFRRMMVKLDEKSEKFRNYYSKFWVRLLDRFLIGKRAKDVKAMFVKAKYVRKVGVALAVILVGGFLVAAHFLQGETLKNYATKALTNANKAEANLDELGISLLGGDVKVAGVQLTDPKNPQQNQLSVEKAEAKADMYELLLGKLVLDKVELSQVRFNQARQTPGVVLPQAAEETSFDPNEYQASEADLAKLEQYVQDAKKIKEQLGKLRDWLPDSNQPATAGGDANQPGGTGATAQAEKKPETYLGYLDARSATPPTPRMLAREVIADKTEIPSPLFGNSKIEIQNVSDAPQAAKLPVTIQMKSYDTAALLKVVADYSKGGTPEISGSFEGIDLSKMQADLSQNAGLAFQAGQASGTFTGTATKQNVDLTLNVSLKNLQAKGTGQGVLGLGAEQTSQALQALKELTTTIRVVGPVTEPRLVFDTKGLTKEFQDALVNAGKERLVNEANKQIEKQLDGKLGEKLPAGLKDTLKGSGSGGTLDSLGGLLGGKKKQEEKKQ